jgi:hypothetical protein
MSANERQSRWLSQTHTTAQYANTLDMERTVIEEHGVSEGICWVCIPQVERASVVVCIDGLVAGGGCEVGEFEVFTKPSAVIHIPNPTLIHDCFIAVRDAVALVLGYTPGEVYHVPSSIYLDAYIPSKWLYCCFVHDRATYTLAWLGQIPGVPDNISNGQGDHQ